MKILCDTYPQLYDFQKQGVDFLSRSRAALLADDVGTGKTAQAIHACQQVGARNVLVICTASIKYNWKKEAIKWGHDERDIYIIDNENISKLPSKGMFIINYDLCWRPNFARVLLRRKFDVFIADECHALKNHTTKRARAVWLRNGYADIAVYRWMLTATPVLNRPVELHPMLKKLCPEKMGQYINYIAYTKRYCEGKIGKWGYDATGADNLEELSGRLAGFMLRRTRDVLPDKTLQKIYLPYSAEIEKYLFTGQETDSVRRKIGLGKVEPSTEHIESLLESEEKLVVFAYHTDVIARLVEKLKAYHPVVLQGATPSKKRQEVIDTFVNDPKCRVFIGQIQAAGEGIDGLQHVASMAVFVEIAYTPGIIKQAIGRVYREGQKNKCLFQFLIVEGTIDEQVLNTSLFKEKNIQIIMKDEKFGLDFSKQPQKEEQMDRKVTLEEAVKALEEAVQLLKQYVQAGENTPTESPSEQMPQEQVQPKQGRKKAEVKKVEAEVETTPQSMTKEEYENRMYAAANRISESIGDSVKTNALFAKLQAQFRAKFPQYSLVFEAKEEDYATVVALVDQFLTDEKIK